MFFLNTSLEDNISRLLKVTIGQQIYMFIEITYGEPISMLINLLEIETSFQNVGFPES